MKKVYIFFGILILSLFFTGCKQNIKYEYYQDVAQVVEAIDSNKSSFDYENFVDIEMKKSELIFNHTTEEEIEDQEFCNIVYTVKFRNITSEKIEINYKLFLPEEFATSIIYSSISNGPMRENTILESGQGLNIGMAPVMKHKQKLNEKESDIYFKYKDILYLELDINGEKAYIKLYAE